MKSVSASISILAFCFGSLSFSAEIKVYRCFTDQYDPGTTLLVNVNTAASNRIEGLMTFTASPDGSTVDEVHYNTQVMTSNQLVDGKHTYTGWDFAETPSPEATLILEKDLSKGVFLLRPKNEIRPFIASVSCKPNE